MKLKELRKKSGYSQKELAEQLGYAQNTISQWESGRRYIDKEALITIADFFGVTTDYLLDRAEQPGVAIDILTRQLVNVFNKLNNEGKREAIKRVSELSQLDKYKENNRDIPIAAHNDAAITEEELRLMQEDIDEL
ncbi:MAG: helix-turn-helix domain-containing protein [Lentihominibacter sp.]